MLPKSLLRRPDVQLGRPAATRLAVQSEERRGQVFRIHLHAVEWFTFIYIGIYHTVHHVNACRSQFFGHHMSERSYAMFAYSKIQVASSSYQSRS